ncbi:hypothetical protein DY000_02003708 [Brassica cretica]|uniref:F-box associated domain-containing protein n=1 Tax=Brassica cretica TaxID=69181 RepID=A0ABQ7CKQ2_BRACR|nr:hypothetical protein DY000_02003708 [Brassica cretica]
MNVNGSIHWVFILEEANKRVVVAFDVKTEEFREVPLPGEAEDVSRNFVAGDLNGRLCVINSCSEEHDDVLVRCSEFLDQNPVHIFVQVTDAWRDLPQWRVRDSYLHREPHIAELVWC